MYNLHIKNSIHVFNHKSYDMHSFGMFPFQAHLNYDKFPGNDAVTLNVCVRVCV